MPDPEDLYRQLENVFMKTTNYKMPDNGILIEPDVKGYSLLMDSKFEKKITFDIELSNILIEKILPN